MKKSDLVRAITEKCNELDADHNYTMKMVRVMVDSLEPIIISTLQNGGEIKLFDGLKIYAKEKPARTFYSAMFEKDVEVPAHKRVYIKVSNRISEIVNEEPVEE